MPYHDLILENEESKANLKKKKKSQVNDTTEVTS